MLSAWLELVNMSIQSYSIQTFHIFSLNRATMSAGDRLHHKQRSQMWSKLTNIFCDKNPFIIHPTPPPQIPTITTDQTKTYENNMYLIYIYISLQYHVRSLIYQRMSLLSFFLGFAMQSLNVSREAPRPGWCPGFSLLPLHVAPMFFVGYQFWGLHIPIFPCFLLGGNLLGFPIFVGVCFPTSQPHQHFIKGRLKLIQWRPGAP